ncbi:hypothetical protein ACTJLC_04215 [Paraburkholderia sp. 22099]|jgi:hypothetical protein|uniref:hypothetical protein n=1 Tax=Paraburkholderia TaxID=1822464 RepID=UPI00285EE085|nr:hypothetical protein [Paraburkholderia terricola]MDR6492276.1 hypothetical protein [Paraburkholderia terricola]
MGLLNIIGTVIFLAVVALSLLAVFDVLSLKPGSRRGRNGTQRSDSKTPSRSHLTGEEDLAAEKPARRR